MSKLEEEIADGSSLAEMTSTPKNIVKMNTGFSKIATSNKLAERLIQMLKDQQGLSLGCQVDLYDHGLQTATRAYDDLLAKTPKDAEGLMASGLTSKDEELVVVALLHDVGETLLTAPSAPLSVLSWMKRAAAADFSNTHSTPIRLFVARR